MPQEDDGADAIGAACARENAGGRPGQPPPRHRPRLRRRRARRARNDGRARTCSTASAHAMAGVLYTLADTALSCACNSHNQRSVAHHCSMIYLAARPARRSAPCAGCRAHEGRTRGALRRQRHRRLGRGRRRIPRSRPLDRRRRPRDPIGGEPRRKSPRPQRLSRRYARQGRSRGRSIMADGAYWDRSKETRSRAEREAEVLANLQRQLHDVYERLPFYRAHYDKHGFKPEQVKTLDDFAKRVPIITKPMLRDDQTAHGPFGGISAVSLSTSSACTARPAPAESRPSTPSRGPTGTTSPTSWRRASIPAACAPATSCNSPPFSACSWADGGRCSASSAWAPPRFRSARARPNGSSI